MATTNNYLAGTIVEIQPTENVQLRFPELAQTFGIVISVPIHPSTWYTVRAFDGDRLIKLQTTAMKIVPKSRLPVTKTMTVTMSTPLESMVGPSRSRSNSMTSNVGGNPRSRSNSVSSVIAHFTKGSAVKILGTDNVLQRVPHLVGCIGTIREVPVHPTTWFKIEFPDGAIVTFRPSAFRLAADSAQNSDDDDDDDHLVVTFPKKASRNPTVYTNQETIHTTMDNPDLTVGGMVRVREGRFLGETGEILKLGNGWVQVLLDGGEVSKRSHELEVIGRNPSTIRSRSGRTIRAHHLFNGLVHRPPKIPRVHPMFLISSTGDDDGVIVSKQADSKGPHHSIASPMNKVGTNAGPTISFLYELERQEIDCPFPLIDSAQRKAKRHRVQAYVDRESDAVLGRPNFSLWLSRLHQSLCVSEVDKENGATLKRCRHETPVTSYPTSGESSEAISDTESFDEGVSTLVGHQTNELVTSRSSEAFFVDAVFSLARCANVIPSLAIIDTTTTTYHDDDDASESSMHRMDSGNNSSDDMDYSTCQSTNHDPMVSSQMTKKSSLTHSGDLSTCSLDEDPSAMLVKIRADSMYAETDNECSPHETPELSSMAYDSCGTDYDCFPPPLELPPAHVAAMSSSSSTSFGAKVKSSMSTSSLSSACPKDFSEWTQRVANTTTTVTFMTN